MLFPNTANLSIQNCKVYEVAFVKNVFWMYTAYLGGGGHIIFFIYRVKFSNIFEMINQIICKQII